jgi:hypothetical protein
MTKLSKVRLTLIVLVIISAFGANVQAEEVNLKILAPWEAAGQVFKVGPEKLQFIGTFEGIMYIEKGEGELDAALFVCPATQEIDLTNSQTIAHGRCMITEGEGDFVYAEFTCKGVVGACQGKFNITDGEGQFKGIKGSSDMTIRSALGSMAVDLKSGSVVQAAEGLAVWPNLKYTLPAN